MTEGVGVLEPKTAQWTAADFLLHGRYCERDVIAAAVARLRALTESRLALLIAYRGPILFHTLLLLSDVDEERGRHRQAELLAGARWRQPGDVPLQGLGTGEQNQELLERLRGHPPFEQIADALVGDMKVLYRASDPTTESAAAPTPASIHVVLVDPKGPVFSKRTEAALDELLVMVNGSAAAVVHGNLKAEELVDQALGRNVGASAGGQSPDPDADSADLSRFAKSLLQKALELTGSRLGNVYMAARDGKYLELIAHERNAKPRSRIEITDKKSVVSWVYRRNRPMVINNIPDFLRDRPGGFIDVAGDFGTPQRELAVPIVQHVPSEGGSDRVIGVVNVEKLKEGEFGTNDVYSYRDVTVLRSVAHRIALQRASSLVDQASATLAGLMKRSTSAAEWHEDDDEEGVDPRIPADAIAAKDIVLEALGGVHRLTQSYSATVRLLSPDRRCLVRFAAFPPERMRDSPQEIDVENHDSVTAWVGREGEICDLRKVRDRREFRRYPGLRKCLDVKRRKTRSELCVPIIVGGRVVGVMNLESRFRYGYIDSVGIAGAVAEQVGLAIQYARRFHEQAVLSMSTATTANVHELGKLVDRLRKLAPLQEASLAAELNEIGEGIVSCSQSGAVVPELPPVSIRNLVFQALDELQLRSEFTIYQEPPESMVYAGADALTLRGALAALIDNARDESDADNPGLGIAWRMSRVGGKEYGTLLIANRIALEPDADDLRNLFRRPLRREHSSRVRLGAFTAGALVRSLGGDVFIEHSKRPFFIVGVDLPVDLSIEDHEQEAG